MVRPEIELLTFSTLPPAPACGIHRAELVAAIGKPCTYCGDPMAAQTRDHIGPRSMGGTLEGHNKALARDRCNTDSPPQGLRSSGRPGRGISRW
jgi:hypothetical protein